MRLCSLVLTPLFGLCSAHAHAQAVCPWLTEGTAATVIDGPPELAVKLASQQEGSCAFTLQNDTTRSSLEITVSKQPLAKSDLNCPAGSPAVVGIGNQAVICHLAASSHGDKQLVLSQVRGTYFSIMLTAERKDSTTPAIEQQRDRVTMIAEQVAGNLF